MKIQGKIGIICIKKCIKWFLLLIFLMAMYIISISFVREPGLDDYIIILGGYHLNDFNYFGILVLLFQYSILIYFTYLFFNYEYENAFENIILRIASKSWIKNKMTILLVFVSFFRCIYSFIISIIIGKNNYVPIDILCNINIVYLLLVVLVLTVFSFGQKRYIVFIPTAFSLFIVLLYLNNLVLNIITIIILVLLNYIFFKFKFLKV